MTTPDTVTEPVAQRSIAVGIGSATGASVEHVAIDMAPTLPVNTGADLVIVTDVVAVPDRPVESRTVSVIVCTPTPRDRVTTLVEARSFALSVQANCSEPPS
jgi:hypothetical protein